MKPLRQLPLIAVLALVPSSPAAAAPPVPPSAPVLQHMLDCAAKTEDHERLACFDALTPEVRAITQKGAIVVGQDEVRAARRQAFGFDLSALKVFERGEKPEEVDRVSATIAQAYQSGGKWTLILEDGAVWSQTDDEPVHHEPKKGSKAEIRRAALGSYFINIDGQRAIRAHRTK